MALGDDIEGDAKDVAAEHAAIACEVARKGKAIAIFSGGETRVAIGPGAGRGGRILTDALALARALQGHPHICAFAAESDGIDGSSRYAGAMVFPDTLDRCGIAGIDLARTMSECKCETAFVALGDRLETEPTFANVDDLRCILVGMPSQAD